HGHNGKHRAAPRAGLARLAAGPVWRLTAPWHTAPGPAAQGPTAPGPTWVETAKRMAVLLPLAAVIFIAGGPIALAVPVLAIIGNRRARWLPAIAATAMFAAGVIAAAARTPTTLGSGPFGGPAQGLALIALGAR